MGKNPWQKIFNDFHMGKKKQEMENVWGKIWSLLIDELALWAPFFVDKAKCGGKRVEFAWSVLQLRFNPKNFRS